MSIVEAKNVEQLTSWPSPTEATLNILCGLNSPTNLIIYNEAGARVDEVVITGQTAQYDASLLSTGLYVYIIESTGATGRFIKK